jgi:hypothetical protein
MSRCDAQTTCTAKKRISSKSDVVDELHALFPPLLGFLFLKEAMLLVRFCPTIPP